MNMRISICLMAGAVLAVGAAQAQAATLDDVRSRGALHCGVNAAGLIGFASADDQGNWKGFDVDYCRAIAAAVFGDPSKVQYVPLTATERFTALQSNTIDVLARNTTWTMDRDTKQGLTFAGTNYYDGQGFMVRTSLGLTSALELAGASICVQTGTTTELNLADFLKVNNLQANPVVFERQEEADAAYDAGRCDAYTTDASGLYSIRLKLTNPDEHMVLPEIISKEPLGPVVRQGDSQWFNIVKWVHFALLNAEELGVTQANVEEMKSSADQNVRRLLGVDGEFGTAIGLSNDWAANAVKAVGNYGESFERNVGSGSNLKIDRGLNRLWSKGGIQYAPPIR
jgi:general L-amino acid transport system substrate-binding protein